MIMMILLMVSSSSVFADVDKSSLEKEVVTSKDGYTTTKYTCEIGDKVAEKELQELGFDTTDMKGTENIGVSPIEPIDPLDNGGISTKGTSIPSNVWNVAKKGEYKFSGTSNFYTLYSNYLFTGKTKYSWNCTNRNSSYTMNLKLKTRVKTYDETNIKPKHAVYATTTGLNKSTNYYLRFGTAASFVGSIR